ncbi:hypothetical protein IG631_13756 [Alternaria alternata]|nr:hypothetical protein IG631_13756 [Alternaria alternata]
MDPAAYGCGGTSLPKPHGDKLFPVPMPRRDGELPNLVSFWPSRQRPQREAPRNLAALSRNAAHSQAHCRPHLLGTGRIARFISDCSMIWHHTGKYGLRTYAYATPLTTKATLRWPRSPAYN